MDFGSWFVCEKEFITSTLLYVDAYIRSFTFFLCSRVLKLDDKDILQVHTSNTCVHEETLASANKYN